MFSTADDNDDCDTYNCAAGDAGAWWFRCCSKSKLNFDGLSPRADDSYAGVDDVTTSHMLVKII